MTLRNASAAFTIALLALQLLGAIHAQAASTRTLVVDQGDVQCGNAGFNSIGAAIADAQPGDTIRVCPGLYREALTIDKSITLRGQPDVVAAVDCWDPAPSGVSDRDPALHAILDGSQSTAQTLVTITAPDVVVEGLVLQGAKESVLPADTRLFRRAIHTSDDAAGYRIHHNMFELNTVAIQFGSAGGAESRFDHNCLRDNLWGLAIDDLSLIDARADHNTTFRTANWAFEPALGSARNVAFDHNQSRQDHGFALTRNSVGVTYFANSIESARLGIVLGGGAANVGTEVAGNVINNNPVYPVLGSNGLQTGIACASPPAGEGPNSGLRVHDNVVTGMRDGIVAAGPPMFPLAALVDSQIANNLAQNSIRDGIVLRGGNARNTVNGNTATDNGRYGIYLQCSADGQV